MGTGAFPPEVKQPAREADHSPPSSAEVKNDGAIPPLPHTSSWRGASLIKHRDNFKFVLNKNSGVLKSAVILDVTRYSSVEVHRRFGGTSKS
jgi:hypothetical protein